MSSGLEAGQLWVLSGSLLLIGFTRILLSPKDFELMAEGGNVALLTARVTSDRCPTVDALMSGGEAVTAEPGLRADLLG